MTPSEIRSLYVETLARAQRAEDLKSYPQHGDGTPREDWAALSEWMRDMYLTHAAPFVDALASAGLLPTGVGYREAYEPDGTPLGYREPQILTNWREAALQCSGCGATERECGAKLAGARITARWPNPDEVARQKAEAKCCPECRHPTRVVSE